MSSIHDKKSRVHFYAKKVNTEYIPSCRNIHCDKEFLKSSKASKQMIDSTKKAIFQKQTPNIIITPLTNMIFDRFTRKKATEIFNTLNILKLAHKENIEKTKGLLMKNQPKVVKKEEIIRNSLIEYARKEKTMRKSSVLNTMSLIPNVYNRAEIQEVDIAEQIKTSVEKNSTKIFGIDRLIKGRIQKIFGKNTLVPLMKPDVMSLKNVGRKLKPKRKGRRTKTKVDETCVRRSKLLRKLSIFDQKHHAIEHEQINTDMLNYKIDEIKGEIIENDDLENEYNELLVRFSNENGKNGVKGKSTEKIKQKFKSLADEEEEMLFSRNKTDEEFIYRKATDIINKMHHNENIVDFDKENDKNEKFQDDITENLKTQGYYLFKAEKTDGRVKRTSFPLIKSYQNMKNTSFFQKKQKSIKNFSDEKTTNNFTRNEEITKFSDISQFINKTCSQEHKSNKVLIKDLKGKGKGIVGNLRLLTRQLGVLTQYEKKKEKNEKI